MRGKEFLQQNWKKGVGTAAVIGLALSLAFSPDQNGGRVQTRDGLTPTRNPSAEVTPQVDVTKVPESLAYPAIQNPEPSKQLAFPHELVAYEASFEDGDYFQDGNGDIDVPQYYYRVMTAGTINIPELGVACEGGDRRGCLVILVNHFGPTAMFRDADVDNGFTVAGRVFDMSTPQKTTQAGQALLNHYAGRMTNSEDGANCGVIDACESVEWHVVIIGNGQLQSHSSGVYTRPERTATPTVTPTATATPNN
jgi:hypothetical protein